MKSGNGARESESEREREKAKAEWNREREGESSWADVSEAGLPGNVGLEQEEKESKGAGALTEDKVTISPSSFSFIQIDNANFLKLYKLNGLKNNEWD